jgi:hypothetical protein
MTQRLARGLRGLGMVVATLLASSSNAIAQTGTIVGRVITRGTSFPVSYTVVSAKPGAGERFTSDNGQFTFKGVPAARVVVRAKHIGYAPFDTAVIVPARDTLRLTIELSLIAIRLPAIQSLAKQCGHAGAGVDTATNLQLAMLFEQLKMNAERHALLSREYPFELRVERKITKPEPALEARFVAFDTVSRESTRDWSYAPGNVMGTREIEGGVFGGRWFTVNMPELADFADEQFLRYHCFDFGGTDIVEGDTLIRIDFIPSPLVHDADVSGAVFLDRDSYQLRRMELNLVNISKPLRARVAAQSIRAKFAEVFPGVPMLSYVSSIVIPKDDPKKPAQEPATETHRVLSVRFLRGKP